jgi:hypothetical protein
MNRRNTPAQAKPATGMAAARWRGSKRSKQDGLASGGDKTADLAPPMRAA